MKPYGTNKNVDIYKINNSYLPRSGAEREWVLGIAIFTDITGTPATYCSVLDKLS